MAGVKAFKVQDIQARVDTHRGGLLVTFDQPITLGAHDRLMIDIDGIKAGQAAPIPAPPAFDRGQGQGALCCPSPEQIALGVAAFRKIHKLTQREMGEMLDIPGSTISKLERGQAATVLYKSVYSVCSLISQDPVYRQKQLQLLAET